MGGQACVFYGAAQVSKACPLSNRRPLLRLAFSGASEALREALDAEARAEQAKDRAYWAPLKAELEVFRRAEREGG
jgi:hypothetical protein